MLFPAPATLPADDLSYDHYRPIHHGPPSRDRRSTPPAREASRTLPTPPAPATAGPTAPAPPGASPAGKRGLGTRPGPDRRPAPPHHRGRMRQAPAVRIGGPRPGRPAQAHDRLSDRAQGREDPRDPRRTDPGGAGFGRLDQRALAAAAALRVWDGLCPAHGPSCPDIFATYSPVNTGRRFSLNARMPSGSRGRRTPLGAGPGRVRSPAATSGARPRSRDVRGWVARVAWGFTRPMRPERHTGRVAKVAWVAPPYRARPVRPARGCRKSAETLDIGARI